MIANVLKSDGSMHTHMGIILQNIEDYQNEGTSVDLKAALKLVSILRQQLQKLTATFRGSCEGWPTYLEKALDRLTTYTQTIGIESIAVTLKEKGTAAALAVLDGLPNISGDLANLKYIFQNQDGLQTSIEKDIPGKNRMSISLSRSLGRLQKLAMWMWAFAQRCFPRWLRRSKLGLGKSKKQCNFSWMHQV